MSNIFRNVNAEKSVHQRAVADIQNIITRNNATLSNPSLATSMISLESLDAGAMANVQSVRSEVETALRESPTFGVLLAQLPTSQQEVALEAAAMTIMTAGNPTAWHTAAKVPTGADGIKLVNPNQGTLDYRQDYTTEGFEAASMNQFTAQSAYVNAMVAVQGGFEEAFFPIQIVPANVNGVDVSISVPKVYSAGNRSNTGSAYSITKTNIIKALVDSTVLENNVTEIVPNIANASAKMVANGTGAGAVQWPQSTVIINGESVVTNPLLLNTEVDLIGASTNATLVGTNETDTLDSVINVGTLYANLVIDDGTTDVDAKLSYDVSSQMGSLLQRAAENSNHQYITTFKARMVLQDGYVDGISGANGDAVIAMLAGNGVTKVVVETMFTCMANTEYGNIQATVSGTTMKFYSAAGVEVVMPSGAGSEYSATIIGFKPKARRTNANFRSRGTIIDSTTIVNYRFPVPLQSPFISQNPIGGQVNTSIEGLAHAERIRNNNNAVKTLLALENVLAAGNGMPQASPAMGTEMSIEPTYIKIPLDLNGVVVSLASKDSIDNLRGAFMAAIMTVVDKMIQQSGYLAALEFATGNNNDYEVIIVADSRICPWIMESGDSRSLGTNRKFKVTQSLNSSIKDTIYISLRRARRDGQLSPLDFGGFLYTPALTHTVQVSRGNSTVQEIHTVPRNAYYATLPVLGRIDVSNMVELFTQ